MSHTAAQNENYISQRPFEAPRDQVLANGMWGVPRARS